MTTIISTPSLADRAKAIFEKKIKPRLIGVHPEDFLAIERQLWRLRGCC